MTRRTRLLPLLVAVGAVVAVVRPALAADHADGSTAALDQPDASSDINDVFIWTSGDASKVNLAMSVFPGATTSSKFSDAVKYSFHLLSKAGLLDTSPKPFLVTCTFSTAQAVSCWVVDQTKGTVVDYVTGDASSKTGLTSASGKVKVFTGLRNDPFFFNLPGFKNAAAAVAKAAADVPPGVGKTIESYTAGCPKLKAGTGNALLGLLSKDCTGTGTAVDAFDKPGANAMAGSGATACVNQKLTGNILAIVIQLDKTLVGATAGPVIGVWGSTNK